MVITIELNLIISIDVCVWKFQICESIHEILTWIAQLGMPIHRRFSFLGDSGNRGLHFFHFSGIGESRTFSSGSSGNFQGIGSP